jgi:hypothetical protein
MSKSEAGLKCRLIMDVFRDGTIYSANIYWQQASGTERDPLAEAIVDSIGVEP